MQKGGSWPPPPQTWQESQGVHTHTSGRSRPTQDFTGYTRYTGKSRNKETGRKRRRETVGTETFIDLHKPKKSAIDYTGGAHSGQNILIPSREEE